MKRWIGVVLLVVCAGAVGAQAQIAPYAMFSANHYSGLGVGSAMSANSSGGITALGGTFGVYDDWKKLGPLRVGPDVRGIIANSSNSTPYGNKVAGGLVGLRIDGAGIPAFPVNPYFQAEIGIAGTNNGTQRDKSASFAYQFQFGGDITIFPHVAARLEYGAGQLVNTGATNHTLQTFARALWCG